MKHQLKASEASVKNSLHAWDWFRAAKQLDGQRFEQQWRILGKQARRHATNLAPLRRKEDRKVDTV
eukprot:361679-Chlamydomonas_euryale.AAC.4